MHSFYLPPAHRNIFFNCISCTEENAPIFLQLWQKNKIKVLKIEKNGMFAILKSDADVKTEDKLSTDGKKKSTKTVYPGGQEERGKVFVSRLVRGVSGAVRFLHRSLPLFLFLIHGYSTGPKRHHQQQATDDRGGLEEVVLEEVVHGLVDRDGPECVEVHINSKKPHNEGQSS